MSQGRRSPLSRLRVYSIHQDMVKPKRVKYRKTPKIEMYRKRLPDYSELAYREAVAKLKYLLAESYTPVTVHRKPPAIGLTSSGAEKDWSQTSLYPLESTSYRPLTTSEEVSPYLRRQEEYIEHLEKEGQLYREELSRVLDKVKEVVGKPAREESTEEEDSDKEPKGQTRSRCGPSIVYSSRISELEAQLTQCRLELRKANDEASYLKAHSKPIQPPVSQQSMVQLECLQREKEELNERVSSLQNIVSQLRDKEASASQKAKRSLDVVDQAQFDKNQLEMEVRRLRSELERMNEKQREALQESARRVSEAERRYAMQMERLNGDLAAQWDAANRLNLELDRAKRTETELRRELAQKAANMEELKKELTTKTGSLQTEALTAGAERESLEAELAASRMATERAERQGRQETVRLQAEVQALRARLDRADQDLLYSKKENIRLADVIAGLEKELNLAKLTKDSVASKELKRADELTSMIKEMDSKHAESVSDLEGLIQSQTELMEKLNAECQGLTRKLEESSARHKEEMAKLQNNVDFLSSKLEAPQHYLQRDDEKLGNYKEHDANSTIIEAANRKAKEKITPPKEIKSLSYSQTGGINDKTDEVKSSPYANEKSEIQPEFKNPLYNKDTNKSYPLELHSEESNKEYQQEQPQHEDNINYEEDKTYDKIIAGDYKQEGAYDQRGTEGYDQTGTVGYDQTGTEEYDQAGTVGYDQTGTVGYDQTSTEGYDQTGTVGYDQTNAEGYDQTGRVGYDKIGTEGYDKTGTEEYDQAATVGYDQTGTVGYDQGQGYDQTGTEGYDTTGTKEYDQAATVGYDQTGTVGYDQTGTEGYDTTGTKEYDQAGTVGYDQTDTVGYDHGQGYGQTAGNGYEQGPNYNQGEMEGYQQGQVYQTGNEGYQGQPYDQQGTEGYDPNQIYDQSTVGYDQNQGYDPTTGGYSHEQAYDQTAAAQYQHGQVYDQTQGEGYDQNQSYDQTGEAYPPQESYDPNSTDQAYLEGGGNYQTEQNVNKEKN